MFVTRVAQIVLVALLMGGATHAAIVSKDTLLSSLYILLGAYVIILLFGAGIYEKRKQGVEPNRHDSVLMLVSLIGYALFLIVPLSGKQSISNWTVDATILLLNTPLLGFTLKILAFFFVIAIIWYGLMVIPALLTYFIAIRKSF